MLSAAHDEAVEEYAKPRAVPQNAKQTVNAATRPLVKSFFGTIFAIEIEGNV